MNFLNFCKIQGRLSGRTFASSFLNFLAGSAWKKRILGREKTTNFHIWTMETLSYQFHLLDPCGRPNRLFCAPLLV
jgi:hypothetical protein